MLTAQAKSRGLGVWFKDEIKNTLLALDAANLDIAQHIDTPEMRLYRKGYEAAIQAMAIAFGISYTPATVSDSSPSFPKTALLSAPSERT
ncbi:MAG TPA: hypothetical protein EYP49_14280 [Anaerolineae bacterium]|nr:hypothetical protein [Anaerolineae bacterium]